MSLITIFLVLVVVGVVLWAVTTYIPMAPPIKAIIIGLAVLVVVIWLLQAFGLLDSLNAVHVGKGHA